MFQMLQYSVIVELLNMSY